MNSLIENGIVLLIIKLIDLGIFTYEKLVIECLRIINHLTSNPNNIQYLLEAGILPRLIPILDSTSEEALENTIGILAAVTENSIEIRDFLVQNNICNKIKDIFSGNISNSGLIVNSFWLITNICKLKPILALEQIEPLYDILKGSLESDYVFMLRNSIFALSVITENSEYSNYFTEEKIFKRFLEIVTTEDKEIRSADLRIIGNISSWREDYAKYFMDQNLISLLSACLNDENMQVRKNSAFVLCNLMGHSVQLIQRVFNFENNSLIEKLFYLLHHDNGDVGTECLRALVNICDHGNFKQIQTMVDKGLIEDITVLLKNYQGTPEQQMCLNAISNIFFCIKQESTDKSNYPIAMKYHTKVLTICKKMLGGNASLILKNEIAHIQSMSHSNSFGMDGYKI